MQKSEDWMTTEKETNRDQRIVADDVPGCTNLGFGISAMATTKFNLYDRRDDRIDLGERTWAIMGQEGLSAQFLNTHDWQFEDVRGRKSPSCSELSTETINVKPPILVWLDQL